MNSIRCKNICSAFFIVFFSLPFTATASGYDDIREIDDANYRRYKEGADAHGKQVEANNARFERLRQAERNSDAGKRRRIEASKAECASLGFRPETEDFGRCVLQLMR